MCQEITFFVIQSFYQVAYPLVGGGKGKGGWKLNLKASSKASCFWALEAVSLSKRVRLSFGSGASGSNSGGGDGRTGGVEGFAGSRICVDVDIKRFSISLFVSTFDVREDRRQTS